ncbi:hypothetical protein AO1008_10942 [Aspergillus oryzae 100-8]|uniref:Uncharacterized protein n=1 Tax=Aspergillus oryzae (strain 3.042) TaxID=1160506 RepID=I8ITT3_ASPO3|nr:hypothetical protein Ao3042_11936 [Aspergillus oryzae 3.042]KDE84328.1 hypothetical protein AO1008_10942 [Aspergillus oryzae 100-8]|eukprot:EIT82871.1 hypothetical protein Ao3042_11936 [Aspergillus oryzae 3.042]
MKKLFSRFKHSMRVPASTSDPTPAATAGQVGSMQTPARGKLQKRVDCDILHRNAPVEDLPPEVRHHLLSMLELETLWQYLSARRRLLCSGLETTLRSATSDACAVYQSRLVDFSHSRTKEKVNMFLQSYQDQRDTSLHSVPSEMANVDELVDVAAFYFSIVKPLAQYYTRWTLGNLAIETDKPRSDEPLSKMEETRLIRALYRFQLCCNLFGMGLHKSSFDSVEIGTIFLDLFEPWEVEEISCIYTFAKERYNQIFNDIRWNVHEENPKFEGQRPPTPEGAFDLDNSWIRDSLLKGTISRGLDLLHMVIFEIKDHTHLVTTMQQHISWPTGNFLEGEALGESAQFQRRQEHPSNRDLRQERRDPLPFQGDEVPDPNGVHPPLAWTLIWRGSYSNLYGYYVQDIIRRWGYVMWHATRLDYTGAKELLARQWEADWGDTDPRDNLL